MPTLAAGLRGPVLTIRKFSPVPITAEDLVAGGSMGPRMHAFLAACIRGRTNVVALDAQKFPNSYQFEGSGLWLIPATDLVAAGYALARNDATEPPIGEAVEEIRRLEREVTELHERMAEIARRADVAQALATERSERIADLQLSLKILGSLTASEG